MVEGSEKVDWAEADSGREAGSAEPETGVRAADSAAEEVATAKVTEHSPSWQQGWKGSRSGLACLPERPSSQTQPQSAS